MLSTQLVFPTTNLCNVWLEQDTRLYLGLGGQSLDWTSNPRQFSQPAVPSFNQLGLADI